MMRTIIWDVDDVLNGLTREWLEHEWRPAHPGCPVQYGGLKANPPHEALGVPLGEYLRSLDRFRACERGRNLAPAPEAVAWFARHGDRCRHVALTARPMESAPDAAEWVFRHFGAWIRAFGFVPSGRPGERIPANDATKADWLAWLGAGDVMIDDSPANLEPCPGLGLESVLVPQPWNRAPGSLGDALRRLTDLVSPEASPHRPIAATP